MLSIIIPAYNEEDNIKRIGPELIPVLKNLGKYEIVVIDDGSKDDTVKEVRKLQKKYKNIRLVMHGVNKGLGYAIMTGIENVKGDFTITLDSDFTFHPREIPKLLAQRDYYDCVIGSHFAKGGKTENVPFFRIILSKVVTFLYSLVLGKKISSVTSVFRLYRTKDLKDLTLTDKGFMINAEILFRLLQRKKSIIEVPVTLSTRIYGKTKINIQREIFNNIKFLMKIAWWRTQAIL
ncbi:MAG: glycosyltransferase [Candidatus Aenigmatarchaeota archaeon]